MLAGRGIEIAQRERSGAHLQSGGGRADVAGGPPTHHGTHAGRARKERGYDIIEPNTSSGAGQATRPKRW